MKNTRPRLVFAGTTEFSVKILCALLEMNLLPLAIYTKPDRPSGRGHRLHISPVKAIANSIGINIYQPHSLKDTEVQLQLASLKPDLIIVAAYGLIIPELILKLPRLGCINIHASLLPRWRGAAPIQHTILNGDLETGICITKMETSIDTGPVYHSESFLVQPGSTAGYLQACLSELAIKNIKSILPLILSENIQPKEQDHSKATYAPKIEKSDATINWHLSALTIERKILAFNPQPVAQTFTEDKIPIRIWNARVANDYKHQMFSKNNIPGLVVSADKNLGILVTTGDGILEIYEIQLPGGRKLSAVDFLLGHNLSGHKLG